MAGRFRLLALTVLGVLLAAGTLLPQSVGSEGLSPEGAWVGTATIVQNGLSFPFTDIYTSNATNHANAGTVLCTVPPLKTPIFVSGVFQYYASLVPPGSGNWVRVDQNTFAVTVWRILLNQQTGATVGTAKFWGTLTVEEGNRGSGALKIQYYDLTGAPITPQFNAVLSERLIEVETDEAQ